MTERKVLELIHKRVGWKLADEDLQGERRQREREGKRQADGEGEETVGHGAEDTARFTVLLHISCSSLRFYRDSVWPWFSPLFLLEPLPSATPLPGLTPPPASTTHRGISSVLISTGTLCKKHWTSDILMVKRKRLGP